MQRHIPENPRHQRFAFTLVEVIVVAVIVAILAAVAIPNYMQYLEETRQAAVEQLAETAAASANSWLRRKGEIPDSADLQLHYDATRYTVAFNSDSSITVTDKYYPYSSKVFYK